ncbi:MAG: zinc-binding dehydrogenase, partial [Candidatus Limnocylindrales bacterium]
LGADHVIDYKQVDYTTTGERYDWIVDTDSHHSILRVRRALKPNGVYVTLGGTTASIFGSILVGPLISRFSDRWTGLLLWWKPFNAADVATVTDLIAAGKLKPVIDRRFPLSEVVDALRYVDDGHPKGKVVITP